MRPAKSTDRQKFASGKSMTLNDIPLFAMLKGKMAYVSQRQTVIAQNVANADTPGYAPRDMKAFTFDQAMKGVQSVAASNVSLTNAGHIASSSATGGGWGDQASTHGRNTENAEEIAAYPQALREVAFTANGKVEPICGPGQRPGESLLAIAYLLPNRIGERILVTVR